MRPVNILFLCTHNSARSILGEVLATTLGKGKVIGYSAGSTPKTSVNPIAKQIAEELGYDTKKLYSKSWDEYAKPNSPKMDIVITVCDSAAKEMCPIWPGHPVQVHWGFRDPSSVTGTPDQMRASFDEVKEKLQNKIEKMIKLPLDTLDAKTLKTKLKEIYENE